MRDFAFVIRACPSNPHAHFRRAFLHKAMGRLDLAAADFERARALDPLNGDLVVNYKKLGGIEVIELVPPGEEPPVRLGV